MKNGVIVFRISLREKLSSKQNKNCEDEERSAERDHNPDR